MILEVLIKVLMLFVWFVTVDHLTKGLLYWFCHCLVSLFTTNLPIEHFLNVWMWRWYAFKRALSEEKVKKYKEKEIKWNNKFRGIEND